MIDLMFDLRAHHGTTLLLITHDPELAARCARRIHLVDGQILDEVAAASLGGAA